MSRKRHTRKIRRRTKAVLKWGKNAGPRHQTKSGRTGTAHSKKLKSRRS